MSIDRRLFIRSAVSTGTVLFIPGAVAQTGEPLKPKPAAAEPAIPVPHPKPVNHSAWINFEFAINWERANSLQEMVTGLVARGLTDVTLMISSSGGEIASALSTSTFLKSAGITLTTYNIGNTYSAALLIFLAAERRVAAPTSQFLIHAPTAATTLLTPQSMDDLKDRQESLERDRDRIRDLLLATTRIGKDKADAMMRKTTYIDATTALELGIVTEVAYLTRPATAQLVTMPISTFHGPMSGLLPSVPVPGAGAIAQ